VTIGFDMQRATNGRQRFVWKELPEAVIGASLGNQYRLNLKNLAPMA
jgi:hypothetical protein